MSPTIAAMFLCLCSRPLAEGMPTPKFQSLLLSAHAAGAEWSASWSRTKMWQQLMFKTDVSRIVKSFLVLIMLGSPTAIIFEMCVMVMYSVIKLGLFPYE